MKNIIFLLVLLSAVFKVRTFGDPKDEDGFVVVHVGGFDEEDPQDADPYHEGAYNHGSSNDVSHNSADRVNKNLAWPAGGDNSGYPNAAYPSGYPNAAYPSGYPKAAPQNDYSHNANGYYSGRPLDADPRGRSSHDADPRGGSSHNADSQGGSPHKDNSHNANYYSGRPQNADTRVENPQGVNRLTSTVGSYNTEYHNGNAHNVDPNTDKSNSQNPGAPRDAAHQDNRHSAPYNDAFHDKHLWSPKKCSRRFTLYRWMFYLTPQLFMGLPCKWLIMPLAFKCDGAASIELEEKTIKNTTYFILKRLTDKKFQGFRCKKKKY